LNLLILGIPLKFVKLCFVFCGWANTTEFSRSIWWWDYVLRGGTCAAISLGINPSRRLRGAVVSFSRGFFNVILNQEAIKHVCLRIYQKMNTVNHS
jgi:ABC-type arginine/histidine transport system permease subunit